MSTLKNIIIGSLVALITATIIIVSVEQHCSFLQIILGFVVFILPVSFLSLFITKTRIFFLVFLMTITIYITIKFSLFDFWIGFLLSIIIGGCVSYFRVYRYKPFDSKEYIDNFNKTK